MEAIPKIVDSDLITIPLLITGTLTALTIIIGALALAYHITTIFQNLFYVPIIISCYYYEERGFVFSILITIAYLIMMMLYSTDSTHIIGAVIRIVIFLLVAGVVTYLTMERLKAESELRESEAFNRKLVEDMPNLVIIYDEDRKIRYVNKMVRSVLGYKKEEILGTQITDYIDMDSLSNRREHFHNCDSLVNDESVQIKLIMNGGRKLSVISRCVPMKFEEKPAHLILFADISDCKMAEDALKRANKKLQILSGITRHDINNCLTVTMGNADLLNEREDDAEKKRLISNIDASAQAIHHIIEFTKEYESIGIDAPIWHEWHKAFDDAFKHHGNASIEAVNNLPSGLHILSDPTVMKVFYNLIDNSIRHGSKVTTISIDALESDEGLNVIYEDDGIGVSEDLKMKIFENGFGINTGMGMFLVKELLSMTNIDIIENGRPGQGVKFEISIPRGQYRYCLG